MCATVLIADDNPAVRYAIRRRIESSTELQICGEAASGKDAVEMVHQLRPDMVILDLHMPEMSGLDAATQIAATVPTTAMVLFTVYGTERLAGEAQRRGIKHVISKDGGGGIEHLLDLLRQLAVGRSDAARGTSSQG
jgi:two-component system, NarL family, nitrate/nitrite response regulator NarL